MHMTDRQFANMLLEIGLDDNVVVEATLTASKLLKRYGQSVYRKLHKDIIEAVSPEAGAILTAAKTAGKNDSRILVHTVKLLKQGAKDYKETFLIKSNEKVMAQAEKFVKKQFGQAQIDKEIAPNDQVVINGEGLYYKRSVEKDVRTLLGLYN